MRDMRDMRVSVKVQPSQKMMGNYVNYYITQGGGATINW